VEEKNQDEIEIRPRSQRRQDVPKKIEILLIAKDKRNHNQNKKIKMTHVLRSVLPAVVVDIIKEFTGEACWRRGKFIHIHRIPRSDLRYDMLRGRPKIKQVTYDAVGNVKAGCAWFKLANNKFVVINVIHGLYWVNGNYIEGDIWEICYNGTKIARKI